MPKLNGRLRAERAFKKAIPRVMKDQIIRATLGRWNSDNTVTIGVDGRAGFVWVTLRNQTLTQALNDGAVPEQAFLPVKMTKADEGYYIIEGKDRARSTRTLPASPSGVLPHTIEEHTDVAIASPLSGDTLVNDGSNWVNTPFDERVRDAMGSALVAGTAIGITVNDPADTITVAVTDAELLALAALTSSADNVPYFTGLGTAALAALTSFGRSVIAAASAAAARTVLGAVNIAGDTMTGVLNMGSHKITNVTDPTAAQDAATKAYVDAVASGLDLKASVRVATTANITLSGTQTIDGVAVIAGDRVLVKDQSTAANNGIYVVAAGAWSRATDADSSAEVTTGMFTFVSEGTVSGDNGWALTTNDPITLGTTGLTFVQFSGAGQIIDGAGLSKSGNSLSVNVDNATIEINSDTLRVKDAGITFAKIQSIATSRLLGRTTAGTGVVEQITLGAFGATLINEGTAAAARGDLGLGNLATLDNVDTGHILSDAVDNSKLADMANATVKGRTTAGAGDPEDLTMAQLVALIEAQALYALLAGRAGGQTLKGDTASGGNLTLMSTAHATKGKILLGLAATSAYDEVNDRLGVGTNAPAQKIHIKHDTNAAIRLRVENPNAGTAAQAGFDFSNDLSHALQGFVTSSGFTPSGVILPDIGYIQGNGMPLVFRTSGVFDIVFATNALERARIFGAGGVAVGVSSMGATILGIKAGGSTNDAAVGGVLYADIATHNNVSTPETVLGTYTVPANTLSANGMTLFFEAAGSTINSANAKNVKFYFGGTSLTVLSIAGGDPATNWFIRGRIVRTGAATQIIYLERLTIGGGNVNSRLAPTETLSGAIVTKVSGTGGASNEVAQEYFKIWYDDANT